MLKSFSFRESQSIMLGSLLALIYMIVAIMIVIYDKFTLALVVNYCFSILLLPVVMAVLVEYLSDRDAQGRSLRGSDAMVSSAIAILFLLR